jgi:carbamoyl-phosphate synthase large subunit
VKQLTILVSASGAPGTAALVRNLRENGERPVRIVGTDMSEGAIGRHLCDEFHVVPGGSDPAFAEAMLDVCRRERVDAVLPQSSFDLLGLAEAKERFEGIAVMVASPEAIRR